MFCRENTLGIFRGIGLSVVALVHIANSVVASAEERSSVLQVLAGQVIVHPVNPRWLVYNRDDDGDGNYDPFFMSGPGDPEDFLYRGTRNPDGTRTGDQLTLINKLKATGANSIYFQAIRSHGGDGESDHNPFIGSDPTSLIDQDILTQWETWFTEMDNNGIVIFFFFYDDAIRVSSSLDWDLDGEGNLHSQELYFIQTLVNRFEHHKHLIWVVMEEVQEMGSDYVAHAKKIAAAIKQADDHDHVVAVHKLSGLSFSEFADDPNIDQFAIQYNGQNASGLHNGMVTAWDNAAGRYNLNMSEASGHYSSDAAEVRKKSWAAAMGGAYVMVLGMDIEDTPVGHLEDAGRLSRFMESTLIYEMAPHDELVHGSTEHVLANPGTSYIAYASDLSGDIGLKDLREGTYQFRWIDIPSGNFVTQETVSVSAGDQTFSKPETIGSELAVHLSVAEGVPDTTPPSAPENLRFR